MPTWCFDQGRVLQTPVAVNATHSMHTNHRVGQAQYRTSSCKQCQVRTILWALTQKVRSNARRSRGEGRAGGSVPLKGDRDENSSNLIFQGQESMLREVSLATVQVAGELFLCLTGHSRALLGGAQHCMVISMRRTIIGRALIHALNSRSRRSRGGYSRSAVQRSVGPPSGCYCTP